VTRDIWRLRLKSRELQVRIGPQQVEFQSTTPRRILIESESLVVIAASAVAAVQKKTGIYTVWLHDDADAEADDDDSWIFKCQIT